VNEYLCPDWLKLRKVTDGEYASWLDRQANSILKREARKGKRSFPARAELKQALHSAAKKSNGSDPYSGAKFCVKHLRGGWCDEQKHLKGNRHHLTLRRNQPSFDHVKGLGQKQFELCTRETNFAKSFMSPKQFLDLCRRVVRFQKKIATPDATNGLA
jgi:hypothetical protein